MTYQKNSGGVRRFAKLARFANWLQTIPNRVVPPAFRLIQVSCAFWQSRALHAAASLDIATVLGSGELHVNQIAVRVGAQPDAVYRLLRMLAAMGIFEESAPRVLRNNRLSAPLAQDHPKSVRAMILMHNSPQMSKPWYEQLENGMRTSEVPFKLAHKQELFDYMNRHADFDALFSAAMDSVEALTGASFIEDFDWGRFDRIIDVGGSRGSKSIAIIKRHPQMKAIIVDRPQVVCEAEQYWPGREPGEVLDRVSFQAGDLLGSLPLAGSDKDIYLLSAVLHGLDDETCVGGLRNLRDACASTGARIAVMELVMPEKHADLASTSFDMQMFMGTRGRERTLPEWQQLFEKAGLTLEEQVKLQSFPQILVLSAASR